MVVWALAVGQVVFLVLVAPLVQGLIARTKGALQGRHGPSVLQPYFTLAKWWQRQDIRPETSSWVFMVVPLANLGIVIAAALTVPLLWIPAPLGWGGDFIVLVGLLALERYGSNLSGLDTATPFGGLGSSRSSTIGALVEPALFAWGLPWMAIAGSTAWPALMAASAAAPPAGIVRFFGLVAALIISLAETGRLPVDNPDTHLELTMIHEAMTLEYSGPSLAMVSLTQMIKQVLVMAVVADLLVPWGVGWVGGAVVLGPLLTAGKWVALALGMAVAESLSAKLRFFRLPSYLGAATALSSAAAILQVWGAR